MELKKIIRYAKGEDGPVDLLLANARIVDVYSGKITESGIAVAGGRIVGIGDYEALETVDLKGRYAAPGFFDAHVHIESSMLCPPAFARAVVPFGTTSVAADPHEIANVLGADGIRYMLESSAGRPVDIHIMLPSCVPATHMETAGASLGADDLAEFISRDRVPGLAEMMNFPGVLFQAPDVLKKIEMAGASGKPADGHAPGLSGRDLCAYVAAGISSDHECTTAREAEEKLSLGMHIMIREGTGARNLKDLLPAVNEKNHRRFMFCTDDRHPHDILERGHMDSVIRDAVSLGLDPITAIRMATLNPAEYFGIKDVGAIAPGKKANIAVFSSLEKIDIQKVYHNGVCVASDGELSPGIEKTATVPFETVMNIDPGKVDFAIPSESGHIRVIEIVPDQIVTKQTVMEPLISKDLAVSDISRDLLKIAVVERYTGNAGTGKGFVKGLGLENGAVASSVAHDSHNIIVAGANDRDMMAALESVVKTGGGLAVAADGKTIGSLALPVAGLMTDEPVSEVKSKLDDLLSICRNLGATPDDPFMILSFLALPVIPELKITDKGLVDVGRFEVVSLFCG